MKITRDDLREFILHEIATISDEAKKAYDEEEQYTPKEHKVENTYNVTVDPVTGKLKRGKL